MQHIERNAAILRQRAGVGPLDRFEPQMYADQLKLRFIQLENIDGLRDELFQGVQELDARKWSGISTLMADGYLLIGLNPNMTVERENVTILEEVAHAHYGHTPVELQGYSLGLSRRRYNEDEEREAYWTAGAALLPSKAVGLAVYRGDAAEDLATAYAASVELAEMRIKTLRLWPYYNPELLPVRRAS